MKATRWLWLVAVVAAGASGAGCVVKTDGCTDSDGDGICDVDEGCVDANANGICDVDEGCVDANANGVCDEDEGCVDANANGVCDDEESLCSFDDDLDGVCWEDDCNDLDAAIGPCDCLDDIDCDGESDLTDCYDDYSNTYVCADVACTPADNYCEDSWYIVYCVDDVFYGTDCNTACTTDDRVYGTTCAGTPAASGECGAAEGACICWCEDSFDSCVNDFTVQYTREGTTYEVDCKTYCGGTCDAGAGACACP